jgi:glycosyltransferase involved in cell wall biosynthesis
MRIAYLNANYLQNHAGGGFVHMGQFVTNATALGHETWAYSNADYPEAKKIPTGHLDHVRTMRRMDALYIRLESRFPEICKWSLPPRRWLYGFPMVVWEFNTIPDDALFRRESEETIQNVVKRLKHYGQGCDLAVCVAPAAAKYVKEKIGIARTLVIPNGSDPDLFKPDAAPASRMAAFKGSFNIVWIGSAKIKYHDFEMLKETARIIWDCEERKFINFHIIGPDLKYMMADMAPNVFYWGAEDYRKLPNWLAAMDIGLYITKGGSSAYGSPLKVFDYLASGLAVVSTTHPAVRDLFDQLNQLDLMVPPGDSKALADVLLKLSKDNERVHHLGLAGRQLVIDRYNWRRAVQDTMDEMEAILKEKGKVPKA